MDRREFMKTTAVWGAAAAIGGGVVEASDERVPRRVLGKTGAKVSIIGLGGITVMNSTQEEADEIIHFALDHGVNYFDVAPSYGHSEERYGPALERHRDRIFLACKTIDRTKDGAAKELRTSLMRLRTDHLDLYQIHALNTLDEVDKVLGPDGAMETFLGAREKGLIRHIGFSAHSIGAALAAIQRFDFDTVMFPINWICYHQGHFGPQVVAAARAKKMGIVAIKSVAPLTRSKQADSATHDLPIRSEDELTAMGLRFSLAEPVSAAVPRGHTPTFRLAVSIAEQLKKLSDVERKELAARSADFVPMFNYDAGSGQDGLTNR